uniref:Uncharacterized protein n=1 Tax=Setaria viridis TaxID=4556 RepID=A0A4U6VRG4_SETVI|nr:hypothetical protein SEVIR_2G103900v2 [Setaria viridis]
MSQAVDAVATRDLLEAEARRKRKAAMLREWKGAASRGAAVLPKGRGVAVVVEQEGAPNLTSDSTKYCLLSIPIVLQRPQPHWRPNLHRLAEWSFLEPRNWW